MGSPPEVSPTHRECPLAGDALESAIGATQSRFRKRQPYKSRSVGRTDQDRQASQTSLSPSGECAGDCVARDHGRAQGASSL